MFSILCIFAANALLAVKNSLIDPMKHLSNWNKGDPCAFNWTGVFCSDSTGTDGYFHVQELYVLCIFFLLLIISIPSGFDEQSHEFLCFAEYNE